MPVTLLRISKEIRDGFEFAPRKPRTRRSSILPTEAHRLLRKPPNPCFRLLEHQRQKRLWTRIGNQRAHHSESSRCSGSQYGRGASGDQNSALFDVDRTWETVGMKMLALAWIFIFASNFALADTSYFHKLSVLRFAHEEVVPFQNGTLDITQLGDEALVHAQGEVFFVPDLWIDPFYMTDQAFVDFMSKNKAVLSPLRLKAAPTHQDQISANLAHSS